MEDLDVVEFEDTLHVDLHSAEGKQLEKRQKMNGAGEKGQRGGAGRCVRINTSKHINT